MSVEQDIIGNSEEDEGVLEEVAAVLAMLSWTPYMTLDEMAALRGKGKTSTREHVTRAEEAGLVAHVLHGLHGRKGWRRYRLTGKGVQAVADGLDERASEILDRPGTTGRALATYHRRLNILVGVYQTTATIAARFDEPELRVHLPLDGPLDGVVRMPTEPYSLGIMVQRRFMDPDYFGLKVWRYRAQLETKPSALLVVAHSRLAEHGVKRLVQRNWEGLFFLTSLEYLGNPDALVWREPNRTDGVERLWSTLHVLQHLPRQLHNDYKPPQASYRSGTIPGPDWQPRIVLTPAQWRALYVIADWPLARNRVIAALAEVTPGTLDTVVTRLREHGLVDPVKTRFGDRRLALTDAGIRFICWTARAGDKEARKFWSARKRADGRFIGTKIQKLNREIRHTDMVHDIVARVAGEARAAVDIKAFQILPAHLTERRPVMPDARIDLQLSTDERYILLLEAERGSLSPREMENRLDNYARVMDTERFMSAFPVRPQIAVALEDPDVERDFGEAQVRAGRTHLPIILTNMAELTAQGGVLQAVWRRPGEYGARARFMELSEEWQQKGYIMNSELLGMTDAQVTEAFGSLYESYPSPEEAEQALAGLFGTAPITIRRQYERARRGENLSGTLPTKMCWLIEKAQTEETNIWDPRLRQHGRILRQEALDRDRDERQAESKPYLLDEETGYILTECHYCTLDPVERRPKRWFYQESAESWECRECGRAHIMLESGELVLRG